MSSEEIKQLATQVKELRREVIEIGGYVQTLMVTMNQMIDEIRDLKKVVAGKVKIFEIVKIRTRSYANVHLTKFC